MLSSMDPYPVKLQGPMREFLRPGRALPSRMNVRPLVVSPPNLFIAVLVPFGRSSSREPEEVLQKGNG